MTIATEPTELLPADFSGSVLLERATPASGGVVDVTDKATGEVLYTAGLASKDDIDAAVRATRAAQEEWSSRSPVDRGDVLREFARLCHEHQDEIGGWIIRETGSIPPKAPFEILTSAQDANAAAALTAQPQGYLLSSSFPRESKARRVPLGVVAVITPWNSPFILATRVILPALAMGNGCVLRPDIQTPVCGGYLVARLIEMAGAPAGLVTVVPGDGEVGAALVEHPGVDMVSFTGSTATGRKVGAVAGERLKKVALELGGNNATIIFPDADLHAVASATAFGSFFHQGQICFTIGRHLVHESVAEEYTKILVEKAGNLHVGDPATQQVHLGPIINETQAARAQRITDESIELGAKVLVGGQRQGLMFEPTVVTGVTADMPLFTDEIFGPIGGMNASGNGARSGGPSMADEYSQWQWVTVNADVPEYPF